ncbi:hypothetical protein C1924_18505 [Stenotrophomonas sp. ESTM1D_MKCIP4_1]|uniref:hypothetical protein n=1 Tax=Stenotrophomonas sp. ESTM1D_MKCIP4_1 TaxID=2072414 RepID=UPI000D53E1FF|nr:hypothetical protein [Stenotrophomonas sp. ESTM1D_MKCIP4_1]AWH55036.1 hypothetical protein C1924_18505 [Stenotrophomonas sp. ESTM1D_MKCIP4_1]
MHSDHAQRLPDAASSDAAPEGVSLPPQDALLDDAGTGEDRLELTPPRHRLPQIALPDNVVLKGAVQTLVEQKARLDRLAAEGQLGGLLPPEWQSSGLRAIDLPSFVQGVLPFLHTGERGETAPARLPVRHVLGDDSRWGVEDVAEPKSLAWYLAADDRATAGSKDLAEAWLVGALGLAWMQAGRSRPGFLRAMDQDSLAARVTMLGYPPPGELALYNVTAHGQAQVWCVYGRRKVRPLVAPWLSVPLLTAYGVAAPAAWPAGFPPVDAVAEAIATVRPGRLVPEVDLGKVVAKIAEDAAAETWQPVSLLQLNTWSPRWTFFLGTFVGLPSLLLVAAALALPGAVEAATVAASLGFAGGAIAALAVPWIHARRKHLS